ncbi:MAG: 30S ribosomal protein S17 [candidate division Zixibacteria bacterium]|nr:30S ribosomal protein S17 [Candidatus Tariuqbacter arcticus]
MSSRGSRKVRTGVVVSDKMDKTISVKVERYVKHSVYKKYYRSSKKYLAHDTENSCRIGDKVSIMETRPLSKRKRWRLLEIVEKAK